MGAVEEARWDSTCVTKSNFQPALEEFKLRLADADYVAIDVEMTSLQSRQPMRIDDDPEQRYKAMCRVADEFALMQVGVCIVGKSDQLARPTTFHVFPSASSASKLTLTAATAHWHASNGFDFNRWVRDGIPFVDRETEKKILDSASKQQAARCESRQAEPTNAEDAKFISRSLKKIRTWVDELSSEGMSAPRTEEAVKSKPYDTQECDREESKRSHRCKLPPCNAFLRRCLFQSIAADFPQLYAHSVLPRNAKDGKKQIIVELCTEEEMNERVRSDAEKNMADTQVQIGFRLVWSALQSARVPIIGHNCLYDLIFLYRHLESQLPPSLGEFKLAISGLFPEIWDTKLLAIESGAYGGWSDTALAKLHDVCSQEASNFGGSLLSFANGYRRFTSDKSEHEAGYDAMLTAAIFARLKSRGLVASSLRNKITIGSSLHMLALDEEDVF